MKRSGINAQNLFFVLQDAFLINSGCNRTEDTAQAVLNGDAFSQHGSIKLPRPFSGEKAHPFKIEGELERLSFLWITAASLLKSLEHLPGFY